MIDYTDAQAIERQNAFPNAGCEIDGKFYDVRNLLHEIDRLSVAWQILDDKRIVVEDRAEKAERELAEHCAHTDALIAAAQAIEAHDAFEPAYLSADLNDKLADLSEALRAYRDSNQAEGAR